MSEESADCKERVARIRKKDVTVTANDQETANVLYDHFEEVYVKEESNGIDEKPDEKVKGEKAQNAGKLHGDIKHAGSCSFSKPHEEVNGEKPENDETSDDKIIEQ